VARKRSRRSADELVPEWVDAPGGVIVDEIYIAKLYAQARADKHGEAQAIYESTTYYSFVVQPQSMRAPDRAYHSYSTTVFPKSNPSRKRNRAATQNTHDPQQSGRYTSSAVAAAEKHLGMAEKEWSATKPAKSLQHLLTASYWIGRGRVEAAYAMGYVDDKVRKRLHALEQALEEWPKEFARCLPGKGRAA
jgi:hypothetical protein